MIGPRTAHAAALALAAAVATISASPGPDAQKDTVAAEIARWAAFLKGHTDTGDLWKDIKQSTEPALARAQSALAGGRPLLALLRLGPLHENLSAAIYVGQRTVEQRKDNAAFEAEWTRMGGELRPSLSPPAAGALDGLQPALLRGMAEAAVPQVKIYYDASLEYGRNTMPDSGLFYLGAARAARAFAGLARRLSVPSPLKAPALRALGPELDALEAEMLGAYRPPLSIDKHREFIGASSALKEARELDAAGLRHGALLRYLLAAMRFASLRAPTPTAAPALAEGLRSFEPRLHAAGVDHSLGRLFQEAAQADLADHAADGQAFTAAAVVSDVLPRYFAALEPARPPAARAAPRVTVTLVRWPYT
jgi:hypothetical protein